MFTIIGAIMFIATVLGLLAFVVFAGSQASKQYSGQRWIAREHQENHYHQLTPERPHMLVR